MSDYSFWLGDYEQDRPNVTVTYTNFDSCEGLPDEELTQVVFEADFTIDKLPEECPEMVVIEEFDHDE